MHSNYVSQSHEITSVIQFVTKGEFSVSLYLIQIGASTIAAPLGAASLSVLGYKWLTDKDNEHLDQVKGKVSYVYILPILAIITLGYQCTLCKVAARRVSMAANESLVSCMYMCGKIHLEDCMSLEWYDPPVFAISFIVCGQSLDLPTSLLGQY